MNNANGSSCTSSRTILSLLKDVQLYQVACVYMPTRLFVNLSQIYVPLYLHKSLNMPATSLAIIPLIMCLSSFIMSLLIERLNTKLGRKISYCFGVFFGIFACIWIKLGIGVIYTTYEVYPISVMLGFAGSIMLVTSLSITADYIGQSVDNGAFVYGIMSFTDKLCNGLAVILIQYLETWINSINFYQDVLVYACSASAILALLMMLYIKPFHNNGAYTTLSSVHTTTLPENESSDIFNQEYVT